MKFITYMYKGKQEVGVYTESGIIRLEEYTDMVDCISNIKKEDFKEISERKASLGESEIEILAPIRRPIHDIICVGKNYMDHILEFEDESDVDLEDFKLNYFSKRASNILGDKEEVEARFDLDDNVDYESELAIIIGREAKNIKREDVYEYIFGFSIFNDLSSRRIQIDHVQWFLGKSLDNYSILGPWIVTKDEFKFPLELDIGSQVNEEKRQDSNTKYMIKSIEDIMVELSSCMTLEPGDIISTGTPAGVGKGFNPPRYLKHGDTVKCTIEGIGSLESKIIL